MGIRTAEIINYLIGCALEVIYCSDGCCVTCGGETRNDYPLCENCYAKIKKCTGYIVLSHNDMEFRCYSAAYYSKIIKELVLRLKYKKDFRSAEVLAELMGLIISKYSLEADYITYVPVSRAAMKKRGYNQSEVIARVLGKITGIRPMDTLRKTGKTKDQIGLGKEQRWENIKGSFLIRKDADISGKRFLLLDDVVTTGATAFWCAGALMESGALDVVVLTAAKSGV
ncbi:MAG: ComF family protein [Clostridiaceae bacterium]